MKKQNKKIDKMFAGLKWFGKSGLWIIPLLFCLDIVTKLLAEKYLWKGNYSDSITIIPNFFSLEVLHNKGAAWGMFAGNTIALAVVSALAGAMLVGLLIWKFKKLNRWYKATLYLMIPGALGNLIDRAFYRNGVIDFLKFTFGSYEFPTFNIADSCLVIGACILLVYAVVEEIKDRLSDHDVSKTSSAENINPMDNNHKQEISAESADAEEKKNNVNLSEKAQGDSDTKSKGDNHG